MTALSKSRKVMQADGFYEGFRKFSIRDDDTNAPQCALFLSESDYEDFGSPEQFTVTVEPGDLLNEENAIDWEAEAATFSEMEAGERVDPLGEDSMDIEQCGIRQSHPAHRWGVIGATAKMCEGLS